MPARAWGSSPPSDTNNLPLVLQPHLRKQDIYPARTFDRNLQVIAVHVNGLQRGHPRNNCYVESLQRPSAPLLDQMTASSHNSQLHMIPLM